MQLYNLYDHDSLVGTYTIKELAASTGYKSNKLWHYAHTGRPLDSRYRVEYRGTEELLEQWDEVREQVAQGLRQRRRRIMYGRN